MCYKALLTAPGNFFTQLARFFKLEQQERVRDLGESSNVIEEDDNYYESPQLDSSKKRDSNKSEEVLKIEQLTREMRERMNSSNIPEDVSERYSEFFDLFGESVFSFIDYDVYNKKPDNSPDAFLLRDLIL